VSSSRKAAEKTALKTLLSMVFHARDTVFGRAHGFQYIDSYEAFTRQVPLATYGDFLPYLDRAKEGSTGELWPGPVKRWAVSSGTTGIGKHIPVTADRLASDIRFNRMATLAILKRVPSLPFRGGKVLSLPGSVEPAPWNPGHIAGEISGHLADAFKGMLQHQFWVRPPGLARMQWEEKWFKAQKFAITERVKLIAGAPAWVNRLVENLADKKSPKVIVTGGQKLQPFLKHLKAQTNPELLFYENYGASEGFFASGWQTADNPLNLVLDNGVFLECEDLKTAKICPLWEAEPFQVYRLIVTSNSGLWRYRIDDLVEPVFSDKGAQIRISGRDSLLLDTLGECLYQHEIQQAMSAFGITSWFMFGAHPASARNFHTLAIAGKAVEIEEVDCALRKLNRHYAIRRETGVLANPEIVFYPLEALNTYENTSLRKAQSKILRVYSWDARPSLFRGI
jgi:hypothetical protein